MWMRLSGRATTTAQTFCRGPLGPLLHSRRRRTLKAGPLHHARDHPRARGGTPRSPAEREEAYSVGWRRRQSPQRRRMGAGLGTTSGAGQSRRLPRPPVGGIAGRTGFSQSTRDTNEHQSTTTEIAHARCGQVNPLRASLRTGAPRLGCLSTVSKSRSGRDFRNKEGAANGRPF